MKILKKYDPNILKFHRFELGEGQKFEFLISK